MTATRNLEQKLDVMNPNMWVMGRLLWDWKWQQNIEVYTAGIYRDIDWLLDNGTAFNRRQAIILTSDDFVHIHTNVSFS